MAALEGVLEFRDLSSKPHLSQLFDLPKISKTQDYRQLVQPYLFCLEQHYRAPGSGRGPTGWHKGVTVYEVPDVQKTADIAREAQRSG